MTASPGTIVAAGVLALVLAGFGYGTYERFQVLEQGNKEKASKVTDLEAQLTAERNARTEEQRRIAAQQGIANEAQRQLEHASTNRDAAVAATDRLLDRLDAAGHAATTACYPSAAQPGASAPGADVVPAQLYRQAIAGGRKLADRAVDLADEADRRRIAGLACERAYDALNP